MTCHVDAARVDRAGASPHTCNTLRSTPCGTCPMSYLCLPGALDERSRKLLDSLLIGRKRLRKGQKLYREGDPFYFLHAVRFGTVKSSFRLSDGSEHVNAFHLTGSVIGFDGLADGCHPTTATALENTESCAIPYDRLMDVCSESPELRERVFRLMGAELVREQRSASLVARRRAEERVAAFLLEFAQSMGDRGYSQREFHVRMSRADLGSHLGTSLETVSRTLSQFARDGFIRVHSRHIEILDSEGLRKACVERDEEPRTPAPVKARWMDLAHQRDDREQNRDQRP